MSLLVVGSVAIDTVQTPTEIRERILGGSATYFSYSASFFGPVRLVGVVGEDFPPRARRAAEEPQHRHVGPARRSGRQDVLLEGQVPAQHERPRDAGGAAQRLRRFRPELPEEFRRSEFIFLANGSPVTQMSVLEQVTGPQLVVADTMDLWIREQHDELMALLKRIDGLVMNDSEAKLLTGDENLVAAGHKVLAAGPAVRRDQEGRARGDVLLASTKPTCCPRFPPSASSIPPAPATALPAA